MEIEFDLKNILKKKGMTSTRLHELTGVSRNTLSTIANNKSTGIQLDTLAKICKALDVTPNDLFNVTTNHVVKWSIKKTANEWSR